MANFLSAITSIDGALRLLESGTGSDFVGIVAPAAITTSYTLTLPATDSSGTQALVSNGSGVLSWASFGTGNGTVTSVALSLPSFITVSGSPVTSSGTLTGTLATQTANTIFSGPTTGAAAAPTFRALVADDVPDIDAAKITSGFVPISFGGTGLQTANQGDLLYATTGPFWAALPKSASATRYLSNTGTSNAPAWAQIDLSNGVTGNLAVTNLNSGTGASGTTFWRGDGTWATPTAGSGTVTSVAMTVPSVFSISGTPITTSGTLALGITGSASGALLVGSGATSAAWYAGSSTAGVLVIDATNAVSWRTKTGWSPTCSVCRSVCCAGGNGTQNAQVLSTLIADLKDLGILAT